MTCCFFRKEVKKEENKNTPELSEEKTLPRSPSKNDYGYVTSAPAEIDLSKTTAKETTEKENESNSCCVIS
jgi:hypothetical protein